MIKAREEITNEKNEKVLFSYVLMDYAPNGDFWNIRMNKNISLDEKALRTYFHQLLAALEYMHSRRIAHLDIKLDNLALDEDFKLKVIDFDTCHLESQDVLIGRGTPDSRAPELVDGVLKDPRNADIFSAGIVLFALKYGFFPYSENPKDKEGFIMYRLLEMKPKEFWENIKEACDITEDSSSEDIEFIDLCRKMIAFRPEDRASIEEIKQSKWYQGPTYSQAELKEVMIDLTMGESESSLKEKVSKYLKKFSSPLVYKLFNYFSGPNAS